MNMLQHTKGPWELSYDQGSYRDIMTKDARICTVRHGYVSNETYHANARLIAAAPELLEAAVFCAERGIFTQACMDKLKSAIAKAQGVSP